MKIDTVIFDLGGVITFPHDREILNSIFKMTKMQTSMDIFIKEYFNFRHDYDAGIASAENYWTLLCDKFGGRIDGNILPDVVRRDVDSWLTYNEAVIRLLVEIRKSVSKMVLLSNINYDALERLEGNAVWLSLFDHKIFSCLEKMVKPDERIYELALQRCGSLRGDCLFIDDNEDNISSAEKFGLNVIRFSSCEDLRKSIDVFDFK